MIARVPLPDEEEARRQAIFPVTAAVTDEGRTIGSGSTSAEEEEGRVSFCGGRSSAAVPLFWRTTRTAAAAATEGETARGRGLASAGPETLAPGEETDTTEMTAGSGRGSPHYYPHDATTVPPPRRHAPADTAGTPLQTKKKNKTVEEGAPLLEPPIRPYGWTTTTHGAPLSR